MENDEFLVEFRVQKLNISVIAVALQIIQSLSKLFCAQQPHSFVDRIFKLKKRIQGEITGYPEAINTFLIK